MSTPEKGEYYDSEGDAAFTEASINRHVEYWIENIYHQRKHRALNMPPAIAWGRAMKNRLPPEKFTAEDLDTLCRVVQKAKISAAGRVHFLCLSWYGPSLQEIRSKLKRGQSAICYYNPLDLGEIWIAHPDNPRNPERAYATHPEYQNGLTLTEHELLHKQYLAQGREFDDSKADVALLLLRQRMAKEYDESRQLSKNSQSSTKTKPKNSERDNHSDIVERIQNLGKDDDIPNFDVEKL